MTGYDNAFLTTSLPSVSTNFNYRSKLTSEACVGGIDIPAGLVPEICQTSLTDGYFDGMKGLGGCYARLLSTHGRSEHTTRSPVWTWTLSPDNTFQRPTPFATLAIRITNVDQLMSYNPDFFVNVTSVFLGGIVHSNPNPFMLFNRTVEFPF